VRRSRTRFSVPPPVVWQGSRIWSKSYFELPLDLFLPVSSEFLEKASYGDPLFRMPTQSNIPITADREYLMEALLAGDVWSACGRALGVRQNRWASPRPRFTEEELSPAQRA
jgi:hypothetical protein